MADFRSVTDVDNWIKKHQKGEIVIKQQLDAGALKPQHAKLVREWFARRDRGLGSSADDLKDEREDRNVTAAERSALAAERSAKWAGWAIVIALAAFALSAWPYIEKQLTGTPQEAPASAPR